MIFPTLAELNSPAKFASKYVTEQSTNQIRLIAMCRSIRSRCVARRTSDATHQRATVVHMRHFYIMEAVASLFDFCDRENVHFISRKAYVTDSSHVEAANFAKILCFQNIRNLHV